MTRFLLSGCGEVFWFSQFVMPKCSFLSVSELDDTDDGSVVNVEAVLLGNVGVTWFESGMN